MDVDLIAEVLAQHRTSDVSVGRPGKVVGFRYQCWPGCEWQSETFDIRDRAAAAAARKSAFRHEAEQVWEAIQHGAPEAPVADPRLLGDAPDETVPAAVEVS